MSTNYKPRDECRGAETSGVLATRAPLTAEQMGDALTAAFRTAAAAAVKQAHGAGLAVPYVENGKAIKLWPDGTIAEIDDLTNWSPTAWKTRP